MKMRNKLYFFSLLPLACGATVISLAGIFTSRSYRSILDDIELLLQPAT